MPAPAFSAKDAQGRDWSVASARERPLLIDFWATWCGPCMAAIPELRKFHAKHGKRVRLLGLSVDLPGWAVVKPAIARWDMDYPVAVGPMSLAKAYGARTYPFLALVHQGRVVLTLTGEHSLQDLEEALKPWL